MTEDDILKLGGYNPGEWQVMKADTALIYLPEKGSVNNLYEIRDRKAVAVIGKGCYYAKKKWIFDTMDIMEAEGRLGTQTVPPVPVKEENAPSVSGIVIPPPPTIPPPPKDPVAKAQEDLKKVVEKSGVLKENVVIASITPNPKSDEVEVEEEPIVALNKDGSVDTSKLDENEAREAIKKHQKATSSGKGKAVGTLTARKTEDVEKEKAEAEANSVEKQVEKSDKLAEKSKVEKKAVTKKPKAKIKGPIPVASDDVMEQLDLVDNIIKACQVFKNSHYALHLIEEILKDDKLNALKKLPEIEKAIQNSKL